MGLPLSDICGCRRERSRYGPRCPSRRVLCAAIVLIYGGTRAVYSLSLPNLSARCLSARPSSPLSSQGVSLSTVSFVEEHESVHYRQMCVYSGVGPRAPLTLVKISKSWNFRGISSLPKGLRLGALSRYCFRAWLSNISCLENMFRAET